MKMLPKAPLIVLILSAFVLTPAVYAQPSDAAERPPAKVKYQKQDANKDGVVSEEEKQMAKEKAKAKRAEKRLADLEQYDENGDGKINKAEREKMKADKEAEKAALQAEREAKKAAKDAEKAAKQAEREAKKAEREAKKAGLNKD